MIVVFEGIDGCGKQTQIDLLCSRLSEKGKSHQVFKFPTALARKAHEHLMGKKNVAQSELFKDFSKDIETHTSQLLAASKSSDFVLVDRYIYSTIAYQGGDMGFETACQKALALVLAKPDIVVFLKIEPALAAARKAAQKTPDVFEADLKFQTEVCERYKRLSLLSFHACKWLVVDASKPPPQVHGIIIKELLA
ncbi:dTMP kinase [Candidatus Parvarchaeota archaeon]|nr:dTMP kinase [Candidatus Parvarchaeota archaeon]